MKTLFILCIMLSMILMNSKFVHAENCLFEDTLQKKSSSNYLNKNAKKDFVFFGGGYIMNSSTNNHQFKNGYNICIKYMHLLNETMGVRFDLDFIHSDRKEYTYNQTDFAGVTRVYQYYGGESKSYLITARLVMGSLDPDKIAQIYFLPGIGVGSTSTTAQYDTFIKGSPNPVYPLSDEDHKFLSVGLSVGLGANVRVYKDIRIFSEAQFNYWYLGSDAPTGFGALKIGVVL